LNALKKIKRVLRLYKNIKCITISVVVKSQWRTRPGCCNASVFCGLCRVCGCRVRRARAIRITRLRSRASEREKKRSSLAFLLHRTTILLLLSKTNRRCAVVAVLTTVRAVRSSWWCVPPSCIDYGRNAVGAGLRTSFCSQGSGPASVRSCAVPVVYHPGEAVLLQFIVPFMAFRSRWDNDDEPHTRW